MTDDLKDLREVIVVAAAVATLLVVSLLALGTSLIGGGKRPNVPTSVYVIQYSDTYWDLSADCGGSDRRAAMKMLREANDNQELVAGDSMLVCESKTVEEK